MIQQWFVVKQVPLIQKQEAQKEDKLNTMTFPIRWKKALQKFYAYASLKCKRHRDETEFEIRIDSGAELCLMSKRLFKELDLPIDLTVDWSVGEANDQRTGACGICHDVEVTIGGIIIRCRFLILENLS